MYRLTMYRLGMYRLEISEDTNRQQTPNRAKTK